MTFARPMEFLFPNRIARVSYGARSIVLAIAVTMLLDQLDSDERPFFIVVIVFGLIAYWTTCVVAPRCRDLAMSPWLAALVFVPGIDLFFCAYLAWGRTKVRAEATTAAGFSAASPAARDAKTDALNRLEALRAEGVLTEQDFLRRKARIGRDEAG